MENPNDTDTLNSSAYIDFGITHEDVYTVHDYLRRSVPTELADLILDAAQYWPCVSSERTDDAAPFVVHASSGTGAAAYYLVTPPIPAHPRTRPIQIQGVVFTLRSCDQGWGGDDRYIGTYNGSYSWFEAGIVRDSLLGVEDQLSSQGSLRTFHEFDDAAFGRSLGREVENPLEPTRRWNLQFNLQVSRTVKRHEIVWTKDDVFDDGVEAEAMTKGAGTGRGFVSTLRPGDRVALVVKAQYPGWANHVSGASIRIFYSV
ncbi:hypothetical protein D9615_010462 [Tricholomella constricta]|uniref:Uncharacterized protein n=1 Tax=Tricholomella constricta TaxID=117010 RepID=A0A8H5GLJ3_9AGAR|nr:hypothetical protein D9615_010462 [Tricholomella constricta]